MKYCVCHNEDPGKLSQKVCDLLDDGWLPVGGVSVSISTYETEAPWDGETVHDTFPKKREIVGSRVFAQAMVLPDKQDNTEKRILTGQFRS